MNRLKHIVNWVIWTLAGLYVLVLGTVQLPFVQRQIARQVAQAVSQKLGTSVSVGRVDLGFFNRLIIDDILIYDQQQKEMLRAGRLTAKVELSPLMQGKIAISSAQIFGVDARLYRKDAQSPTNFQFVLDSLASKDTTKHTALDLRINSFIMRHSQVHYDQWDVAPTPGHLNTSHLNVSNISAHVLLKALTDDSLSLKVKRLAFSEGSGLSVNRLAFQLNANNREARLKDFTLELPESDIHLDSLTARYDKNRLDETLRFAGLVNNSSITLSDLRSFFTPLKNYQHRLALQCAFSGTPRRIDIGTLTLSSDHHDVALAGSGFFQKERNQKPVGEAHVTQMFVSDEIIDFIDKNIVCLPDAVLRLGDVDLSGDFSMDDQQRLTADAIVNTGVGAVVTSLQWNADNAFDAKIQTKELLLDRILDNQKLGHVEADLQVAGRLQASQLAALSLNGTIPTLTYDGHDYHNIAVNGSYADHHIKGWAQVDDEWLRGHLEADMQATSLQDASGIVSLRDLHLSQKDLDVNYVRLESGREDNRHFIRINSDFLHAVVRGDFDHTTLAQSFANIVGSRLPTLPGLPPLTRNTRNNFAFDVTLAETSWLKKLFNVDLDIDEPLTLMGSVNDASHHLTIEADLPAFTYNNGRYEGAHLSVYTPSDTLFAKATITKRMDKGNPFTLLVDANAANNNLTSTLHFDNHSTTLPMSGRLNAVAHLGLNPRNKPEAHVMIQPSPLSVNGEQWQIDESDIVFSDNHLRMNRFSIRKDDQYINVSGTASGNANDSLFIDLNQAEVAYILNIVDFHAVDFSGEATGRVSLSSVFDNPQMHADLTVDHFKFENGRMGVLTAAVDLNQRQKQIDIHAVADDGPDAQTLIDGYVSPERSFIDLSIRGRGTHIDFLQSFTDSFLKDISGHARGDLRLHGPLSTMQLTGMLVVDGQATVKPLGTTYTLRNDTVRLVTDDILLQNIPIYDKYDNVAILDGGIHHKHLTSLTFDLGVHTDLLLGYDFKDFGEDTFYGTVFAAGDVALQGRPGRVTIDCDVTPLQGSVFTYNVASPDAISNQEFITWRSRRDTATNAQGNEDGQRADNASPTPSSRTDIYLNLNIFASPEATMRLLMDASTGDYITLNGTGALRATYYNKGTFQMFGTYTVDHGTYGITIQNIIKKNFTFNPGGTIVFGGDPYDAALQLQATYPVPAVSLSDLSIGNTFSSNTIRVNCLMNITGQPNQPRVDFDLEMPTVNADEQQMVRSVINGEQEMNQQVLYLLSIGRFYQQGQNNEQTAQDQTTLAMQSLLSGTISSQLNNVISSVIKNDDWNFGANISTGTEGWNNAEYEGIVNGRMLNNRLLINGQFGYRDNATQATPSFIGDFDIRYLLYPSGNLALKVYNQTNDRYFTRSSLNTQGIGLIMKKDFGRLNELFRKR